MTPKESQCTIDAFGKASAVSGLADEWKKVEPQVEKHFNAFKQCPNSLYVFTFVKEKKSRPSIFYPFG